MAQGVASQDANSSPVSNLLPELLLGLLGHTGGAFVCDEGDQGSVPGSGIPKLSNAVDWITAPEREQLDGLVRLGHYFAELEVFVDAVADQPPGAGGIYRAALAAGLEELLDVYRGAVLRVEQRLLRPPVPPLLALRHFFADFEVLLPEAAAVARKVQSSSLGAAQIMALLDARTRSGIPAVQAAAERLLWHCHRVMLQQMESWMVYGMLVDPGREFFVRSTDGAASDTAIDTAAVPSPDGYQVDESALPPAVAPAVSQAVLFVGKSVRVLRHAPAEEADGAGAAADTATADFSAALRDLGREEVLRPATLRHAVEACQSRVSAALWDLLQRRCDLTGHLAALQAYFLLGRGDVYQQLLQDSAPLLAAPPAPDTAAADWALAFSAAGAAAGAADADPFFPSFQLRWFDVDGGVEGLPSWHPRRDASLFVPSYDAWDGLCVECDTEGPMALLLPPEVLRRYAAMWQFMFRVKRAQADLEAAWGALAALDRPAQRHGRRGTAPAPRALLTLLGQLRQRMAHFAGNLALYLRLDVAEAAGAALRAGVVAATDFSAADAAHRTYVENLTSQACLDVKQLMGAVEAIFGMIRKLCSIVSGLEGGEGNADDAATAAAELAVAFRLKSNTVFQLMQSNKLQSGPRAVGLRQLVARLNFNLFAEKETLAAAAAAVARQESLEAAAAAPAGRLSIEIESELQGTE